MFMIFLIITLAVAVLIIWYKWDTSISHRISKMDDLSSLYYQFSLVNIAKQIFEEKANIAEQKNMLLKILEMTNKHSRLESKYRENNSELLELAQDWYRYCTKLDRLTSVSDDIAYGDEYLIEKTRETRKETPQILAEIEKKFEKKLTE